MTTVPTSRPSSTLTATWRDFGHLFLLGWAGMGMVLAKQRGWRWLYIVLLVVVLLELLAFGLLFGDVLVPAAMLGVLVVVMAATVPVQTVWRLADGRRVILLSPSRDCAVDVIFHAGGRISLANYTRMRSATSAPALRVSIGEWLRTLPGQIRFRAQGRKIADLYMREFPELVETGTPNWLGLIELSGRAS